MRVRSSDAFRHLQAPNPPVRQRSRPPTSTSMSGGPFFDEVVGEGWAEKMATLAGELEMLRASLTDDDLRSRLESIRSDVIYVIDIAEDRLDGGETLMELNEKCLDTLDRVGQFLTAEWAP